MAKQENRNTLSTSVLVRRFLPYFRKYRKTMAFDLCCAALTTVCELVLPLIVRTITTRATYDVASLTVPFVLMMGGVYMLLRVIDAAANYYMQSIGHIMGSQLETDMRHDIFHHLQELSFGYYSDTKVGQIMARITSDLFEITEFAHHCPEEFLIAGVKILVSFIILCTMNIPMTLMMFAVLPFMLYFAKRFNTKMRQIFKERNKQVGEINAQVEDSLLGIRVVKSFANEEIEEKKFADGNAKFLDLKAQSYRVMAQFGTSNRIFDGLMYIVIVVGGALFIKAGRLSAADFMAYLLYANVLLTSIRRIVEFTEQFQRGMTGIDRFLEIMDAPAEIVDAPDAKVLTDVRGEVAFDHVSFHYQDDDAEVIHNLNMTVRPGQSIALVGPSGAGKTTVLNLLGGMDKATSGRIIVGDKEITGLRSPQLTEYRRHDVGFVFQFYNLMPNLTALENVELAQQVCERALDPREVLEQVGLGQRMNNFPAQLSGGEQQRVSIARALCKNPALLLCDEPTGALDSKTGEQVLDLLTRLCHDYNTTVVIITHNASIAPLGNRLIRMRNGSVQEMTVNEHPAKVADITW